ncbi:MAG TPA: hypothetical protein VEC99_10845, partial [Clostridia bacterium]|nr:hypothetical protein [Clostridia bacterium]
SVIRLTSRYSTMQKRFANTIAITGFVLFGFLLLCNYFSSGKTITVAADAAKCKNNLKAIQNAKARWAREEDKGKADVPTWVDLVGTNRYLQIRPECARGGVYTLGPATAAPKCSLPGHALSTSIVDAARP